MFEIFDINPFPNGKPRFDMMGDMLRNYLISILFFLFAGGFGFLCPHGAAFAAPTEMGAGKAAEFAPLEMAAEHWKIVDEGEKEGPSNWRFPGKGIRQDSNLYGGDGIAPGPEQPGTYAIRVIGIDAEGSRGTAELLVNRLPEEKEDVGDETEKAPLSTEEAQHIYRENYKEEKERTGHAPAAGTGAAAAERTLSESGADTGADEEMVAESAAESAEVDAGAPAGSSETVGDDTSKHESERKAIEDGSETDDTTSGAGATSEHSKSEAEATSPSAESSTVVGDVNEIGSETPAGGASSGIDEPIASQNTSAAAEPDTADSYRIGPGDVLEISLWKDEALTRLATVTPDGSITFPLIGKIEAAGKTVRRIHAEIEEAISRYVPEPVLHVSVQQVNSMVVYVIGRVNRPGHFPVNRNVNVLQALSMAGGLNPFAKKNRIRIYRQNGENTEAYPFDYEAVSEGENLEQNILLKRGDVIVVP